MKNCLNIRFLLSIIICFLQLSVSFSQSVQELEEKLKFAATEEKPGILNKLSEASLKTDPARAIDYAEQALKASRKLANTNEETNALINLGNAYLETNKYKISALESKNIKSTGEIEQLSIDAQIKEFKIKTQKEEIIRKQIEAESQAKANELLKKENELAELELNEQRLILWSAVIFSILGVILTVLVFFAYKNKKKANDLLMQKNELIYKQKEQIEQKSILITDSIDYAKNIQDAILPPESMLAKHFAKSFVLYKPKDIVSGDFFWIYEEKQSECIWVAAADCTGHGVPGAFMSLLGFIVLDDSAHKNSQTTPAEVLKEVNEQLMDILHQNTSNLTGKFGMDISLIKYDKQKREIIFSGAQNPLIVISKGQLNEIKADKVSIGTISNCSFTNHTIPVNEGDVVYLYSDGYQDQIGGIKRKKFLSYHLKELLQKIYMLEPEKQHEELNKKHMDWKSDTDQTDDILIIGLKT